MKSWMFGLLAAAAFLALMVSLAAAEDPFSVEGFASDWPAPLQLEPNYAYYFAFEVFNAAATDVAIKRFDLTLPSASYVLDTATLAAPDALHQELGFWSVEFDEEACTITWLFTATGPDESTGDIFSGDVLTFRFSAVSDANATDGFPWVVSGDDAIMTMCSDTFYFGSSDDDDDAGGDDDTGVDDDSGDDDNGDDANGDDDDENTPDDNSDDDDSGRGCA